MQLLGNTDEERARYRAELLEAKKRPDFDIKAFNAAWLDRCPVIESQPIKEDNKTIERIKGEEITPEAIAGDNDKLKEVISAIDGMINTYKLDHDIQTTFSKEKNGIIQLRACLDYCYDNIVKPSHILKAPPTIEGKLRNGGLASVGDYNTDFLIIFIDVVKRIAGREGLPFTRALYLALTGVSYEYFMQIHDYLTSTRVNLRQKVLDAEYVDSLNMASGSDIGNLRNLNEGEALTRRDEGDKNNLVSASALRSLPMK